MGSSEAFHSQERESVTPEQAYTEVAKRLEELLGSLDEALEAYDAVTLPGGEAIDAENEQERMLARAQTLRTGIEGYVEQIREKNEHSAEEAAALSRDAVEHLEGFLAAQADLLNKANRNPAAAQLAAVVTQIAQTLLASAPQDGTTFEQAA